MTTPTPPQPPDVPREHSGPGDRSATASRRAATAKEAFIPRGLLRHVGRDDSPLERIIEL